jgi:hypothetical protein
MKSQKKFKKITFLTSNIVMLVIAMGFNDLYSLTNKRYGTYSVPFFVKSDKGNQSQKQKGKVPKEEAELKSLEEKLDHFEAMLDQIEDVIDRIDKKTESPSKEKQDDN